MDEPSCSRDAVNKTGSTAREVYWHQRDDKNLGKDGFRFFVVDQKINLKRRKFNSYLNVRSRSFFTLRESLSGSLLAVYYIPIYNRKITMEKTVSKPVDETTFKPFLNAIQQVSGNLPIECDNDMTLIAFAGPTNYDLVRSIVLLKFRYFSHLNISRQ